MKAHKWLIALALVGTSLMQRYQEYRVQYRRERLSPSFLSPIWYRWEETAVVAVPGLPRVSVRFGGGFWVLKEPKSVDTSGLRA